MANSIYQINKGINKPLEFKGLKAQYVWYFAIGVMALLILFGLLYLTGLPTYVCVAMTMIAGAFKTIKLYALSNKYGEHGMLKAIARKSIPRLIRNNSRKVFMVRKKTKNERVFI